MIVLRYHLLIVAIVFVAHNVDCRQIVDSEIGNIIGPIQQKYRLPALGGAILTSHGMQAMAVVGVRKHGTAINVTTNDLWHIGSCTKAMTATLIAVLVEKGQLSWNSTVGSVFRSLNLPAKVADITLLHLLSHYSGLPREHFYWYGLSKHGSLMEQRQVAVADLASTYVLWPPGRNFSYSNWGYVVAAAMAEQVTEISYEQLMQQHVFEPLTMASAGYGPMGTPGKVDQPWGHTPWGPPTQGDFPLVMIPAGLVHLSLADWSKYVVDHLRGPKGQGKLLKPESYRRLHTPPFGNELALGWVVNDVAKAGGQVLTHTGSNRMHYAIMTISPSLDFGAVVVSNYGEGRDVCNEASLKLLALAKPSTRG